MARLKQLGPQIHNVGLAVKMVAPNAVQGSWQRDNPEDRAFYKTAKWQRLRMRILVRDLFTCQWEGCGKVMVDTSQLVADHIIPVRIDPDRKWDEDNLRCLCKACHDGPRQAQEKAIYGSTAPSWKGRGG